jgi:hypothetical protein
MDSQAEGWRYRDDKPTNYPLRGRHLADPRTVGLHQSIRSRPADNWGAVSSAQAVGLRSGLPQPAVTVRPSAPRSVELWGRSQASSQRPHRLLITAITITGITATTITDITRVTTGGDVTVLTAGTPWGAPHRPPRQTRPRGTERQVSFTRVFAEAGIRRMSVKNRLGVRPAPRCSWR